MFFRELEEGRELKEVKEEWEGVGRSRKE